MMPEDDNDSGAEYRPGKERLASQKSRTGAFRNSTPKKVGSLRCRKPKNDDEQVSMSAVGQDAILKKATHRLSVFKTPTNISPASDMQKAISDLKRQDGVRKPLQTGAACLRKRLEALKDKQTKTDHQLLEKQMDIDEQNNVLLQQTADIVVLADKLNHVTGELAAAKSDTIEQSRKLAQEVADRDLTIDCLSKTIEDLKTRVVCLTSPSLGTRVVTLETELAILKRMTAGNVVGGRATPPS